MVLPWSELGRFCISQESELGLVYKCRQELHLPWDHELWVCGVSGTASHFTGKELGGNSMWTLGRLPIFLGTRPGQETFSPLLGQIYISYG